MKKIVLLLIVIVFSQCQSGLFHNKNAENANSYRVYKIDSINNYYLIYAKKNDSLYKIVSKKEVTKKCKRVKVNSEYKFSLKSVWTQKIMIGDVNVSPSLTPHVTCLSFDKSTVICLERDSINDLFVTKNLRGLSFIKD